VVTTLNEGCSHFFAKSTIVWTTIASILMSKRTIYFFRSYIIAAAAPFAVKFHLVYQGEVGRIGRESLLAVFLIMWFSPNLILHSVR
jgi:hypothetical protein